jgi:RHS repeat-associated protein
MKFQRHLLKNTGFKRLAKFRTASLQIKEATTPNGTSKYFYDGAGRRVAKEVNGTRSDYLLMGSEVLKTYENGAPKAEYFLGLGRHGIKTDNAWKYYLTDGLGSTVSLTDDTGSTVAAYDYDDYGETSQIAGSTSVYNPFLYTGQEWDAELGMYNLRARHYAPTAGRFLARDPIGHAGGSNLYSYCNGDPVNFSDPSGLYPTYVSDPGGRSGVTVTGDATLKEASIGPAQTLGRVSNFNLTATVTNSGAEAYINTVIVLTSISYLVRDNKGSLQPYDLPFVSTAPKPGDPVKLGTGQSYSPRGGIRDIKVPCGAEIIRFNGTITITGVPTGWRGFLYEIGGVSNFGIDFHLNDGKAINATPSKPLQ